MKSYNKNQFKSMIRRYCKEYGKAKINTWEDYYRIMKATLCNLKNANRLEMEKAETKAILEYCNQYSDNSNINTSIAVASMVYSIMAIIITIFSENKTENFENRVNTLVLIITVSLVLILITIIMIFNSSRKRKNDIIYYKSKLRLIEEIDNTINSSANKENQEIVDKKEKQYAENRKNLK